jgi:hypothetical protein
MDLGMDGVRSIFIPTVEGESFLVQAPKQTMESSSSNHFSHPDVLDGKLLSEKVKTIFSKEKYQLDSITGSFDVFTQEVGGDFFNINKRIDGLEERLEKLESKV